MLSIIPISVFLWPWCKDNLVNWCINMYRNNLPAIGWVAAFPIGVLLESYWAVHQPVSVFTYGCNLTVIYCEADTVQWRQIAFPLAHQHTLNLILGDLCSYALHSHWLKHHKKNDTFAQREALIVSSLLSEGPVRQTRGR